MKITEYGAIRSSEDLKRLKRAKATGSASFADLLSATGESDAAQDTGSLNDISGSAAVSHMLALQEISEGEVERRKLIQRGGNLLDALDTLRRQILAGAVPPQSLQDLSRQLSMQRQSVSDPRLIAIIDDIELRAAVELAKLEKAVRPEG